MMSRYFVTAFMGTMPLGGLLAGHLAEVIGAPWTVALAGGCCLLGTVLFLRALLLLRALSPPVEAKSGLLPAA
jgi:ABC-type Fe3+-siderophore transport system permease subunit